MNTDLKICGENLLPWSFFEDWESGASAAPTEHTLSGSGASVAREATTKKFGSYSMALTRDGNDCKVYYDYPDYDLYQGRTVTLGCWVNCATADRARLSVNDGVGSAESSYHAGSGWEYLEVTHYVDVSATQLRVEFQVNSGNVTAYFDGAILCEGDKTVLQLSDYLDVSAWTPTRSYGYQAYTKPRLDGQSIPNILLEKHSISVKGVIANNVAATARTYFDTVMKYINAYRDRPADGNKELKQLFLQDDRYLKVFLTDNRSDYKAAIKVYEVDLRFEAEKPFFQYINKLRTTQAISGSPTAFTVTTNGSYFSRPVIKITANGSDVTTMTLENLTTGQKISYGGTISDGESLVIDTEALTFENNGSDDLANITGDTQMILLPGINKMKYTGTAAAIVKVDWIDRWV